MLVHLHLVDDVGSHLQTVLQLVEGREEYFLDNLEIAEIAYWQVVHDEHNLHIYDRHTESVKEVLNNPEYPAPTLWINPEVKDFYAFTEDDFRLDNYQSTKLSTKFEVAE